MLGYVLVVLALFQAPVQSARSDTDETRQALDRAEALYYQARFKDSIELLERVDEQLRTKPDRLPEKINTKLQLALAYIGLNSNDQAKDFFREIYELDPNYVLDPKLFAQKVITLATTAKEDLTTKKCHAMRSDVVKNVEAGNIFGLTDLMESIKSKCPDLSAMESVVTEIIYRKGVDSVKLGEYDSALRSFEAVLKLSPNHELASHYVDLVHTKVAVDADRFFLEWQRNFETRQFASATSSYRAIASLNDAANLKTLAKMKAEYRSALSKLAEASKDACSQGDDVKGKAIRAEISDMLPDPSIGEEILSNIATCPKACVSSSDRLALKRLETRVAPEIPITVLGAIGDSQIVRVKATISEDGDVAVTGVQGSNASLNEAVLSAVTKWKFTPALDQHGQRRCVATEIPILIKP